jgi:hypothetical protein
MTVGELRVFLGNVPDETVIFACEENNIYPCKAYYGDPENPTEDYWGLGYDDRLDHSKPILWFAGGNCLQELLDAQGKG